MGSNMNTFQDILMTLIQGDEAMQWSNQKIGWERNSASNGTGMPYGYVTVTIQIENPNQSSFLLAVILTSKSNFLFLMYSLRMVWGQL